MKRFLLAAVVAMAVGFGTSSVANAQIVYGYSVPVGPGIESSGTAYTPYGAQTFTSYYSPFTGTISQTNGVYSTPFGSRSFSNYYSPFTGGIGQSYSSNIYGATNTTTYGYNPLTGYRYGTGYYQPNAYVAPYSGINYGWLRRR